MTMTPSVARRFMSYTRVFTTSDPESNTFPSTPGQLELARILAGDLSEVGCTGVEVDANGYVMATLPANTMEPGPVIGLIAHMDTSPDFNGKNVNPTIIRSYNGEKIVLNEAGPVILDPTLFPELLNFIGQDLIVTDGTTLLGADDKAGIAEIIEAIDHLNKHPEILHGKVRICFTPDEEIGRGADRFDVEKFGADWAYTLDGGPLGELEYENFNAASAVISIRGINIHPGTAKNKMINAMQVAMDFHQQLPESDRPENTEGYEGFFHLTRMNGSVEECRLEYLIRDHDETRFELRKERIREAVALINLKYRPGTVDIRIKDQYLNMRKQIESRMHIVERAAMAMRQAGIQPLIKPIRGGTDGARLSYMGLPTPNLFTGGHNYHGKHEFIPIPSMLKAVEMIVNILRVTPS